MHKALTITAAFLIASSAFAAGEIWRWKDASGTWHYADQPQPGAELVSRSGRPTMDNTAPATPVAPTPTPTPAPADTGPPPVSDNVAAQVRSEAAAAKTEQCKKDEENYQKAVRARRITKPDGVTFMTNAEIDAYRLQARSMRDLSCGPGA